MNSPEKEPIRLAHNFLYKEKKNDYSPQELELLNKYVDFTKSVPLLAPKKIGLLMICVNPNYWQYAGQVVEDAQKYFLPGHQTDIFLWTDMPQKKDEEIDKKIDDVRNLEKDLINNVGNPIEKFFNLVGLYLDALYLGAAINESQAIAALARIGFSAEFQPIQGTEQKNLLIKNIQANSPNVVANAAVDLLQKYKNIQKTCKIQEIDSIEWPFGTLMRYSLFLQQEEALKEYDYLFYMDIDMRVVNVVGDEILGEGLTVAPHPGYALRKEYIPPYEPNSESKAYIPRPGFISTEDGSPRFQPFYAAGGFQGGVTEEFIKAMKILKKSIDGDFNKNYTAIWNDESHWNKYLFDYQNEKGKITYLTPSYVYPDSLIQEYYVKLWGKNYPPKIITLTKPFTLSKQDPSRFQNM